MRGGSWGLLIVLALLSAGGASCAWLGQNQNPPSPQPTLTSTMPVVVTQGQVRNAITREPVSGARLQAGPVLALSDVEGAFSTRSLEKDTIQVSAPGYEEGQIHPRPGFPLIVELVPNAATTLGIIYDYEKRHEFGRQYDLLHPDVQALFSRDEFIRHMEQSRPYDIVDFAVSETDVLVSGMLLGKEYVSVAQVQVHASVRVGSQVSQRAWSGYLAKAEGKWRWFRGALVWPTPSPTSTATATPTPAPSPSSTGTALPTLAPTPTRYEPIPPNTQAVLVVDVATLHTGPGDAQPVSHGLARGTLLVVSDWPRWVDGFPWYPVRVVAADVGGWCKGTYLAALIVTATPTTAVPTWVPPAVLSIAFTSDRDGNREVYVMNADGTGLRNLTRHPGQDSDPTWTPQHDRLAFVSDRDGSSDIFVMDADGTNPTRLTFSATQEIHAAWSPNGALIAYVSDADGDWEIYVMTASGGSVTQLTHNEAWDSYPSWSPDGRKLAFTSQRDGNYELYLLDLETLAETRLTNHAASDAFPTWSPDGSEIAFASARDGELEIYLLDMTALPGGVTRLTCSALAGAGNRYPTWSAGGYWLAFTSWRDGNAEVYVIGRDGSGQRNLTNHPAADESPAWVS